MVPYVNPPQVIKDSTYLNLYGENIFGEWKKENIFEWVIRLLVFDQLKDRLDLNISDNFAKQLSLAILNDNGKIIGGAFKYSVPGWIFRQRTGFGEYVF